MASRFSGAVVLTDLNDFISPSQACVLPVPVHHDVHARPAKTVRLDVDGSYVEVGYDGTERKLEAAKITLNDCLACSGCVTSAESILVEMQSHRELERVLAANAQARTAGQPDAVQTVVVTVAPQSRASFAAKSGLAPIEVARRITGFLKGLGVDYVLDAAVGADLSLLETQAEFVRRYRTDRDRMPVLASACPGWICYAEKTHGSYILPYISTAKSQQQVMGVVVKQHLGGQIGRRPDQIYHVAVMMCYDKKLEASRQDFFDDVFRTRDVDCVITTGELEALMASHGVTVATAPELPLDRELSTTRLNADGREELVGAAGGGAGGYLEHTFRYAARELFGVTVDRIPYTASKSPDFREAVLEVNGEPVLRFATAYGFRNIQNFVRKVKGGKCAYHFVEIMACPSACLNGGGQLKPDATSGVTDRELLTKTELAYQAVATRPPETNPVVLALYSSWLEGVHSTKARALLHTQYHAVEKLASMTALATQW